MSGTQIRIDIWDDASTSWQDGGEKKSHVLKMGQCLTEAEKVRMLQAMCNFCRTLQLWLAEEGQINNLGGKDNARV